MGNLHAYFQGKPFQVIPVSAAMSRAVAFCRPDESIEAAEHAMAAHKVRRLPVIDAQGRLVGILSLTDIAREAARERTQGRKRVSDAEVGKTLSVVCEPHVPMPAPVG